MKKTFRMVISLIMCILMTVMSVTAYGSGLLYYNDGQNVTSKETPAVNYGAKGEEKRIEFDVNGADSTNYSMRSLAVADETSDNKVVLSFDAMANQTTQYQFTQLIGSNNTTIGSFFFSADGKMGYSTSPAWEGTKFFPNGTDTYSGYVLTEYSSGEWYHIDIVFDYKTASSSYYLNGQKWGSDVSFNKSARLQTFFITGKGGSDRNASDAATLGNEKFYYDNVSVYTSEADEMCADIIRVNADNGEIELMLSEPISANDIKASLIKSTVSGKEMPIKSVTTDNNYVTLDCKSAFEDGTEYYLKLPDGLSGGFGGTIKNNEFYFLTPSKISDDASSVDYVRVVDDTFDDENSTFSWKAKWSADVVFEDIEGRGKVAFAGCNSAKPVKTATDTNIEPLNTYFDGKINTISFDIMLPELLNLSFSLSSGGGEYPLTLYTSEKGWLAALTDTPTQTDTLYNNSAASVESSGNKVRTLSANKWYNFKFEANKVDNTVKIYADGELLASADASEDFLNNVKTLLIKNCSSTFNRSPKLGIYVDNVAVEAGYFSSEPKVQNTRFISSQGEAFGPFMSVPRDLERVDVRFSNNNKPEEASLDESTIKLYYNNREIKYTNISYDNLTYSFKPTEIPSSGDEIKVCVSGVYTQTGKEFTYYETKCSANFEDGDLYVSGFELVDESGKESDEETGNRYVKASLYNLSTDEKNIIVMLRAYSGEKLTYIDYKDITLSSGETISFNGYNSENEIGISGIESYSEISASILNGNDRHYPITEERKIELIPPLNEYSVGTDENVRILGRTSENENGAMTFNWPGSGIEFKFSGTTAAVNVTDIAFNSAGGYEGNYFNVSVDGNEPQRIKLLSGTNIICEGLAKDTEHTVKLTRSSEAYRGTLRIDKVMTDSKPSATAVKKSKILFIGDSYTAGYGNVPELSECTYNCAQNSDSRYSYAEYTARSLDVDADILAYSGKGLKTNNDKTTANNMMQQFENADVYVDDGGWINNANGYVQSTEKWDFNETKPDAVVIWLGTNDYLGTDGNSGDEFKTAYTSFLKTVREKYPNAVLICCSRPETGKYYSDEVEQAVSEFGGDDKKCYYLKFTSFAGTGIHGHPNKSEHKKIADQLVSKIKAVTNIGK